MEEQKSIKEVMELLEGLKLLAVQVKKVMADGKVSIADLPLLLSLAQDSGKLAEGVKGYEQIPAELKDLSEEEAKQLIAKIFEIAAAVKAA